MSGHKRWNQLAATLSRFNTWLTQIQQRQHNADIQTIGQQTLCLHLRLKMRTCIPVSQPGPQECNASRR